MTTNTNGSGSLLQRLGWARGARLEVSFGGSAMVRSALLFSILVLAVGCGAPTPKEVAEQASDDVRQLVRDALATGNQTNNWKSIDDAFVNGGTRPKVPEASSADSSLDLYAKFATRIFDEKNVVSSGGGATVFGLTGTLLCSGPDGTTRPDSKCVTQIDSLKLQLKVSGGLDLTLLVGPEALQPLTLRLRAKKSIAVEYDYAQVEKALVFVNSTLTTDSPFNGLGVVAKGKLEWKLEKNGADDFTLSQSVLEALSIEVTDKMGISRGGSLEARSPMLALRVEGPARKITATVDVGRAEYHGLYRDLFGVKGNAPGVLSIAGLTGQLIFEDGKTHSLKGLGIGNGQTFLSYAGKNVFTLDFNRDSGRKVDLSWATSVAGVRIEASSPLTLEAFTGFEALAADIAPSTV
jgi:hypothetical protein